jgi:hypothetical protein
MFSNLRGRITSAHVIALAALFVALGGTAFAAATIGTNDIKNGAVTKKKLHAKAVTTKKIAPLAVTTGKIADQAVTTEKIADQAVTTDKIADQAVTNGKIAPDAVDSSKILDGSIQTGDLGDAQVSNAKLADSSVTTGKIADAQVRAADLGPLVQATGPETAIANNTTGNMSVDCPAGSTVISGGGVYRGGTGNGNVTIRSSQRNGNGWNVVAYNESGASATYQVLAYCLSA